MRQDPDIYWEHLKPPDKLKRRLEFLARLALFCYSVIIRLFKDKLLVVFPVLFADASRYVPRSQCNFIRTDQFSMGQ